MKQICLLLVSVLIFSFTGCSNESLETKEPAITAPSEIALTTENIEDYLIITCRYDKIEREGYSMGSKWCTYLTSEFALNMEPAVGGSFDNVYITFEIKFAEGWYLSSSDSPYSASKKVTIRLPATGSIQEIYRVETGTSRYESTPSNQNTKVKIISVSGNFVPLY